MVQSQPSHLLRFFPLSMCKLQQFCQTNITMLTHLYFFAGHSETRSSWFNCALRDDEAVCWVSIGYCEALAVGN